MKVVVGGTFDRLHKGHETLFAKAFEIGDSVVVGVTSDAFVKRTKEDWIRVQPVWERLEGVKKFLAGRGWLNRAEIAVIEDNASSPAAERPDLDAIVVSPDTVAGAKEVNALRIKKGMRPLAISIIPRIGAGGKPVSSTEIRKGG
ncbi:MAG: pantetheine-phosphate adenylyltransferase [Candidatus Micrarchaeota archaeon]|nr:pantetheine-phosphate adenylyltransferase [Candidatus Micrarchaeota archaeon]